MGYTWQKQRGEDRPASILLHMHRARAALLLTSFRIISQKTGRSEQSASTNQFFLRLHPQKLPNKLPMQIQTPPHSHSSPDMTVQLVSGRSSLDLRSGSHNQIFSWTINSDHSTNIARRRRESRGYFSSSELREVMEMKTQPHTSILEESKWIQPSASLKEKAESTWACTKISFNACREQPVAKFTAASLLLTWYGEGSK